MTDIASTTRYVYSFEEPTEGGRDLLGGKGIGLAEMTQLGIPFPRASRSRRTRAAPTWPRTTSRPVSTRRSRLTSAASRSGAGSASAIPSGRCSFRPLRRGDLHAGDDGHDPQPRAERRGGGGLARSTGNARFALDSYRRLIQMYGEVVDGIDGHRFESALSELKAAKGVAQDTDLDEDDLRGPRGHVQGDLRRGARPLVPAGPARAAPPRRPRRLRLVGDAPRAGVPARARHPGRPRHGRERRADGLRQQGRPLGDRGVLHARPVDRGAGRLRRVPRERAGRGRGGGDPDTGAARAPGGDPPGGVCAARRDDGPGWSATTATCRTSSSRSRTACSSSSRHAPPSGRPRRR